MCEPTTILAAAQVAARTTGTVVQAINQRNDARRQANRAATAARSTRQGAARQEARARRDARGQLGSLASRQSASGTRASSGSNLRQAEDLARRLEFDILQDRTAAIGQAQRFEDQERQSRARARSTLLRAGLSTATQLLSAGGNALGGGSSPSSNPFSVPAS